MGSTMELESSELLSSVFVLSDDDCLYTNRPGNDMTWKNFLFCISCRYLIMILQRVCVMTPLAMML